MSATGATTAPSGGLAGLVVVVVDPRDGPGIGIGWQGVVSGAAASPSSGLGSVAFGFHPLELPDIVIDWRGFALRGCLLLRLGYVSAAATGAAA
jgi:hypothetical protein